MKTEKPLRIMIVDDDSEDLEFMEFLFSNNKSFELVGCFTSASELIAEVSVKNNIPDVLLMDMYMPLMTGTEAIAQLLLSNVAPELYIFIISTTINPADAKKHIDNPKINFLAKPVSLTQVNDLPGLLLDILHVKNNTKV